MEQADQSTMLTWALRYADYGMRVFPLNGKVPFKGTTGFKEATKDESKIREWWGANPHANIGIATGDGLCVIDFDILDGEAAELYASLPLSWVARTNKGYHVYLSTDDEVSNSAGKLAPGVDVRGDGGYVVAPPSLHPDGGRYAWHNPTEMGEGIPSVPEDLRRQLHGVSRTASARPASTQQPQVLPKGQRNPGLTSFAGALRARGLSPSALEAALLEENQIRCDPPLKDEEVSRIARSVGRYPAGDVGYVPRGRDGSAGGDADGPGEVGAVADLTVENLKADPQLAFRRDVVAYLAEVERNDLGTWEQLKQMFREAGIGIRSVNAAIKNHALRQRPRVENAHFENPPIRLEIPEEFRVKVDGTYRMMEDGEERILPAPLLMSRRLKDHDTGEERVEITWRKDGQWQETVCNRSVISKSQEITSLADSGLPITSNNSAHVVKYLSDLEALNKDTIPLELGIKRTGWAGPNRFVPGKEEGIVYTPKGYHLRHAFNPEGDLATWAEMIAPYREDYPLFRMQLATAFAAPLIEPLGARNFILHNWSRSGGGKALSLDTHLPTPDGWTTMGEVQTGDRLFDEKGNVCNVVKAHDVLLGRDCYEVEFSDGSVITADGDHLWYTTTASERKSIAARTPEYRAKAVARRHSIKGRPDGKYAGVSESNSRRAALLPPPAEGGVRTTKEILDTLKTARGESNHLVRVCDPLCLPERELPIDPYVLGLWLGDGSSGKGAFTTADDEVVQAFSDAGYKVTKHKDKYTWGAHGLVSQLRELDVLNNKHVPAEYLRASKEQRLALLQGLIDSDGGVDKRGQIEFCTTKEALMKGALELILSLGIKAVARESRAKLYGKDCGAQWKIRFLTEMAACRLPRKLERQKRSGFRGTHENRYIVGVRKVGSVPVRCVTVDSPSRLYLAGRQMIPTHNTAVMRAVVSVWGSPKLMVTFNSTPLGLTLHASMLNHLPVCINERQLGARKLDNTIYGLAEGTAKLQGHRSGGLRSMANWRNIILTNGEEPLTSQLGMQGTRNRTIEIMGEPIDDEVKSSGLYAITAEQYGTAGPAFIQKVIDADTHEMAAKHGEMTGAMTAIMEHGQSRSQVMSVALLATADYYSSMWVFGMGEGEAWSQAIDFGSELVVDYLEGADTEDDDFNQGARIASQIQGMIHSMRGERLAEKFHSDGSPKRDGIRDYAGYIQGGKAHILTHVFEGECKRMGISPQTARMYLADQDILEHSTNGKKRLFFRRLGGLKYNVIRLPG